MSTQNKRSEKAQIIWNSTDSNSITPAMVGSLFYDINAEKLERDNSNAVYQTYDASYTKLAAINPTTKKMVLIDIPKGNWDLFHYYTRTEVDYLLQRLEQKTSDKYTDETLAGDIIKRVDINTGENVNYRETTTWYDGSAMDDSKVDGLMYKKIDNKYYNLNIGKTIHIRFLGVLNDISLEQTEVFKKAIDLCTKFSLTLDVAGWNFCAKGQIDITCNIVGNGQGWIKHLSWEDANKATNASFLVVTRPNIIIDSINVDGGLIGTNFKTLKSNKEELQGVNGVLPLSVRWFTDDNSGLVLEGYSKPVNHDVRISNVKIKNGYDGGIRVSGYNVSVENCKVEKTSGVYGDAFLVCDAFKVNIINCYAFDFQRMGFCADSSGWQSQREITFDNCIAEYAHDCSKELGGNEFNAGFWIEKSTEVTITNCKAYDTNVNGFAFSTYSPTGQPFSTQTKCSVTIKDCYVDFRGRNSTVQGNGLYIKADPTYLTTKSYIDATVDNLRIEGSEGGILAYLSNPQDRIRIKGGYVSYKMVYSATDDLQGYKNGVMIFTGLNPDVQMSQIEIDGMEFNGKISDADKNLIIKNDNGIAADISILRFGRDGNYTGIKQNVDLTLKNLRQTEGKPLYVRTLYGNGDNIIIQNCRNIIYRGDANSLSVKDVGILSIAGNWSNINSVSISNSELQLYTRNNDSPDSHPQRFKYFRFENIKIPDNIFLLTNSYDIINSTISGVNTFEIEKGNGQQVLNHTNNKFLRTDEIAVKIDLKTDVNALLTLTGNSYQNSLPYLIIKPSTTMYKVVGGANSLPNGAAGIKVYDYTNDIILENGNIFI